MKRRAMCGLFLLVFAAAPALAQQDSVFRFEDMMESVDMTSVDRSMVPPNYFGDEIALKFYVLQQRYTYVIPGTASSPGDKTEVEKPVIYNNVKKMYRYYRKQVKKGHMSMDDAKARLHHVLNVGLSIKNQQTDAFEDALRDTKGVADIALMFEKVVLE